MDEAQEARPIVQHGWNNFGGLNATKFKLGNQRKQGHGTTDSSKDSRKNQDRVEECTTTWWWRGAFADCIATMNCHGFFLFVV